jgi:hypothetical protein
VIVLGIVLLVVGFPLAIPILWTIGIILVMIGAILALLGAVGHVPTSTDVSAGEPPLGLLKPWPALSQRRYMARGSRSPGQVQGGALPLVTGLQSQARESVNT